VEPQRSPWQRSRPRGSGARSANFVTVGVRTWGGISGSSRSRPAAPASPVRRGCADCPSSGCWPTSGKSAQSARYPLAVVHRAAGTSSARTSWRPEPLHSSVSGGEISDSQPHPNLEFSGGGPTSQPAPMTPIRLCPASRQPMVVATARTSSIEFLPTMRDRGFHELAPFHCTEGWLRMSDRVVLEHTTSRVYGMLVEIKRGFILQGIKQ
jgi:hypothetical protein